MSGDKRIFCMRNTGVISSLLLWMFSVLFDSVSICTAALLIIFITIFFTALSDLNENITLVLFQICTFLFLTGSIFINFFMGLNTGLEQKFNADVVYHIVNSLYISQLSIGLGYWVMQKYYGKRRSVKESGSNSRMHVIQHTSFLLFIITVIPKLITEIEKVRVVQNVGYIESYLGYNSGIPAVLVKLAQGYMIFYWIFLLSRPGRMKTYFVLGINFLISCISLGAGKRSSIVFPILMMAVYLCYRNRIEGSSNYWIKTKWIKLGILMLPIVIALFQQFTYDRLGLNVNYSFKEQLSLYFETTSAELIGYGVTLKDSIPDIPYTFGIIWTVLIRNQSMIGRLFGLTPFANQTVEMALNGNSFGQSITYVVNPGLYLRGGGLGSCYIAEVYQEFSYGGIIIFSIFIGCLLFYFYHYLGRNIYIQVFFMLMLNTLFLVPRDAVFSFICTNLTLTNLVYVSGFIMVIELLSRGLKSTNTRSVQL